MKTLIVTTALSLLAFSNMAEAQTEKNQSTEVNRLLASLPTQDLEFMNFIPKSFVTRETLLASLPTFDETVEVPTPRVNIAKLVASLPTMDENVEGGLILSTNTNVSNLLASLPVMDEHIETSVLVDTKVAQVVTKQPSTAVRLSEE